MSRTILAMGGGWFMMEPANPALDDFILTLARSREPKILFLPTASGDPNAQISSFRATSGARAPAHARPPPPAAPRPRAKDPVPADGQRRSERPDLVLPRDVRRPRVPA